MPVRALVPGMYVSRLDRSWEGTPFPLQGVMVRTADDVDALALYSATVVVDIQLSEARIARRLQLLEREPEELQLPSTVGGKPHFGERELESARGSLRNLSERAARLLDMLHEGHGLSSAAVEAAVAPVVASVVQNQDALLWLLVLQRHSSAQYGHAMNCCVLSVAFGRALALPEDDLQSLAIGGLLMNIGMIDVPSGLVDSPGILDARGHALVRDHVRAGLARFDAGGLANANARAMLETHHERHDGSGYPHGLKETEIPLFGRIAGIVDMYSAMISERPWRATISRAKSTNALLPRAAGSNTTPGKP